MLGLVRDDRLCAISVRRQHIGADLEMRAADKAPTDLSPGTTSHGGAFPSGATIHAPTFIR